MTYLRHFGYSSRVSCRAPEPSRVASMRWAHVTFRTGHLVEPVGLRLPLPNSPVAPGTSISLGLLQTCRLRRHVRPATRAGSRPASLRLPAGAASPIKAAISRQPGQGACSLRAVSTGRVRRPLKWPATQQETRETQIAAVQAPKDAVRRPLVGQLAAVGRVRRGDPRS